MRRMHTHRFRMLSLLSFPLVAALLAGCIDESPLAFSPDGKSLAFVTVEPYRTRDGGFVAGGQTFRLMVLDEQRRLRVLETSTDAMLTAPGWSPDGKRLAYLRVPLPGEQEAKAQAKALNDKADSLQKLINPSWMAWIAGSEQSAATRPAATEPASTEPPPSEPAATQPYVSQWQDQALPPLKTTLVRTALTMLSADTPATLVVREVNSGTMLSDTELELLTSAPDYAATQPQFAPGGREVYVAAGNLLLAIDVVGGRNRLLTGGQNRILAGGNAPAELSPDGRMLAMATDGTLGLVTTDGSLALYRRLPGSPVGGPAWINSRTVVVLRGDVAPVPATQLKTPPPASATQPVATQPADPAAYVIQRVRTDGTLLDPVEIPMPEPASKAGNVDQLATARDGIHLAIAHGHGVTFATLDGKAVRYVSEPQTRLEQPAFSPDSQRVAVKAMTEAQDKSLRTAAIVFYSPQGKEIYRVAIPPVEVAATQAAERE